MNDKLAAVDTAPEPPLRRELQRILGLSAVNPNPVQYWGIQEENDGAGGLRPSALAQLFSGQVQLRTDPASGLTRPHYVCFSHADVLADPDRFAGAVDEDGLTGVHACAINGFLETLQVLVELGGAAPFAQARGRVDALMIARRRGHKHILTFLTSLQGDRGSDRLAAIAASVAERRAKEAAEKAALLSNDDAGDDGGASLASSLAAQTTASEASVARRVEKAAAARQAAVERSLKAIAKEQVEELELLPRVAWRGEMIVTDNSRGVGYYPRKPFSDGDEEEED